MELDITYKSFFALLRAGLWNREPECESFPLTPDMWQRVYMMACRQTVEGIVYDGVLRLPEHFFPPKDLLLRWTVTIHAIEKRNKQMNKSIGEINGFLTNNGITAWLMKGQSVAACYVNPLHRSCGDIDLYFPEKSQFNKANELITLQGIKVVKQAKFSKLYVWKGFMVEHHSRLLDIDNPFHIPYLHRLLAQDSNKTICLNLIKQSIPLPSPLLTHILVNAHILKHLLTSGVGIRQLCDSARICCAYHDKFDAASLKEIYLKLGILRWIHLLNDILVNHLGMPEAYLPFPLTPQQNAESMVRDTLQSGNFGLYGGPFSKSTDTPRIRKKIYYHWMERMIRFFRYVRYAPSEACWNPVVVVYSQIRNWFVR